MRSFIRATLPTFCFTLLLGGVTARAAGDDDVPTMVAEATVASPAPEAHGVRLRPVAPPAALVLGEAAIPGQTASVVPAAPRLDGGWVVRRAVATAPRVTSSFGHRVHPISGVPHFHTGVDLRAAHGATVGASAAGTVLFAGPRGGYGNLVIVDHGRGVSTYYGHLSSVVAVTGQRVAAGQVIGRAGSTGRSTGPHLHYEVRLNGRPSNPLGAIRLEAAPAENLPDGGDED